MKLPLILTSLVILLMSCEVKHEQDTETSLPVNGTWRLLSATIVEGGDTTVTDYQSGQMAIKIINDTHFSFFRHDLNKGKDSTAVFVAGAGSYSLKGNEYTEHLEYCNYREWEDNTFSFDLSLAGDTLIQTGIEKIEELGVDRINTETYIRIKD